MSKLVWGSNHAHGLDRGVLYLSTMLGVPWIGLSSVTEMAETTNKSMYIDGVKTFNHISTSPYSCSVKGYTYPEELDGYSGWDAQKHVISGFSYRVRTEYGYEIHIVYNAIFEPVIKDWDGSDDSIDEFEWVLVTTPALVDGRYISHLVVKTSETNNSAVLELESYLYGSDTSLAHLPTVQQIIEIFESNAILRVIDNGDGSCTITGPDSALITDEFGVITLDWPTVLVIDSETHKISSM